jgi:Spy/CpxP family protein refolding chaperone
MAAANTTTAPRWPSRRGLIALLAVSLALNVLFVAGAVWSRVHAPFGPPGWQHEYRQIAAQLDLDPEQRTRFDRYVADMQAHGARMRQQMGPLIGGAWDEIAKPAPDQAQIMQHFDEASQKWREFQRESATQTLDFLSTLSPAQRSKFVAIVKEHRAARFQNRH